MNLSTKEAVRLMSKLRLEMVECKHHVRGFVTHNGRRLFPVHCSFGNKNLPGNVPQQFRQSLCLTPEEFAYLRSCSLDQEGYIALLRSKRII